MYISQFNASPLLEGRRIQVDTIYNMTCLVISRAERQDAGEYSLTVENAHGSATFRVKVIVLGKCYFYLCLFTVEIVINATTVIKFYLYLSFNIFSTSITSGLRNILKNIHKS